MEVAVLSSFSGDRVAAFPGRPVADPREATNGPEDVTPVPVTRDMVTRALTAAQLESAVRTSKSAVWANGLAVVAIVAIGAGIAPPALLWGWVAVTCAVLASRHRHIVWQGARERFPEPLASTSNHFTGGVAVVSSAFAIGVLLLYPSMDDHRRVLLLFVLAGMCVGGTVALAAHRPAFHAYVLPLLLPPLAMALWRAVTSGGSAQWAELVCVAAFLVCVLGAHKRVRDDARALLRMKLQQEAMTEVLADTNRGLAQDRDSFRERALTDGLTGIANRRFFDESLEEEWGRGARSGLPLAVLLMDVDQFKRYNDHYGHDEGDDCLTQVARIIESVARRGGDRAFRYGGEEFSVLLPDTDLEGAAHVAEAIREAVEVRALPHVASRHGRVTVSIGVAATVPSREREERALVKRADKALYRAKDAGRNRVLTDGLAEDPTVTEFIDLPGSL